MLGLWFMDEDVLDVVLPESTSFSFRFEIVCTVRSHGGVFVISNVCVFSVQPPMITAPTCDESSRRLS